MCLQGSVIEQVYVYVLGPPQRCINNPLSVCACMCMRVYVCISVCMWCVYVCVCMYIYVYVYVFKCGWIYGVGVRQPETNYLTWRLQYRL